MNKLFVFAIFLCYCLSLIANDHIDSRQTQLRDSILCEYEYIDSPSKKIVFLCEMFDAYQDKEWAVELLDLAKENAQANLDVDGELMTMFYYMVYYGNLNDQEKLNLIFQDISNKSDKYKKYQYYFKGWLKNSIYQNIMGNTEAILLDAEHMKKKAIDVKEPSGVFYSELAKGRSMHQAKQEKEALKIYQGLIEMDAPTDLDAAGVYLDLAEVYHPVNERENALVELKNAQEIIFKLLQKNPNHYVYNSYLLSSEMIFCRIYLAAGDAVNLKKHLDAIEKRNFKILNPLMNIPYYSFKAGYYYLNKEYDKAVSECDSGISYFDGIQPLYENSIYRLKALFLSDAKRNREAANVYKLTALKMDSLNKDILRKHEEAHVANYMIQNALVEKSAMELNYRMGRRIATVFLTTALFIFIIYLLRYQLKLRRIENQTRLLLEQATLINKDKELFLRRMTHHIRTPLNAVVGFADLLSEDVEIDSQEKQEFTGIIKENADQLSKIIFYVLYLSRLESGMMNFHSKMVNLSEACRHMLEEHFPNNSNFIIQSSTKDDMIDMDETQLRYILFITIHQAQKAILDIKKEDQYVLLTITSSFINNQDETDNELQDRINSSFMQYFNGRYEFSNSSNQRIFNFYFPIIH